MFATRAPGTCIHASQCIAESANWIRKDTWRVGRKQQKDWEEMEEKDWRGWKNEGARKHMDASAKSLVVSEWQLVSRWGVFPGSIRFWTVPVGYECQSCKPMVEEAVWFLKNKNNASQEHSFFRFWKDREEKELVCSASSYPWQMLQIEQSSIP